MLKNNDPTSHETNRLGIIYALGAFILWGIMPLFFKELSHVPALEFLMYRMIFSFIFLVFLLLMRRSLPVLIKEIRDSFSNKKLIFMLVLSALLICSNWLVFIWAINHSKVLQTSLGYFINPLMNVALGMVLLGEKLSKIKMISVGLMSIGVFFMVIKGDELPWIALYLAASFALYGLIRKKILIGAILGLWIEIIILLPFAAAYLFYLNISTSSEIFGFDNYTLFMMVMSGAATAIPLVLFASAAQRLPLSTIGLLQYIAPSISLMLAVFLWNEPFTIIHMIAFSCIWVALAIYSTDSFMLFRKKRSHS